MALFTSIKCIGGWIELPFNEEGDASHKIFNFVCIVDAGAISSLPLSTLITNASAASVAGLDQYPAGVWPESGDGNCYFIGDSTPQPFDGQLVKFVRSFANVPSTRTRGIGSYSHTWPAFRAWEDPGTQETNAQVFAVELENVLPLLVLREQLTTSSPATVTYTYTYATSITGVTEDTLWSPKWGSSASYDDFQNLNTDNYLTDDGAGGQPYASVPDVTDYVDDYINQEYVIVESKIKNYRGNIWVKETIKALAQ